MSTNILIENDKAILEEYISHQVDRLQNGIETIVYFDKFKDFIVGEYSHWVLVNDSGLYFMICNFKNIRGDVCWMVRRIES